MHDTETLYIVTVESEGLSADYIDVKTVRAANEEDAKWLVEEQVKSERMVNYIKWSEVDLA